jgi:hypothetical protein
MRWPAKGLDTATLNPPAAKARFAFQYPRLLNYPREIRYRLFVDDRRRRFFRLQDFGQVAADQDCEDAGIHCSRGVALSVFFFGFVGAGEQSPP